MLPTLIQSFIPTLRYLPFPITLSVLSPWRQSREKGSDETGTGHDKVNRVDVMKGMEYEIQTTEIEIQSTTQYRRGMKQASAVRWQYAEQGTSMHSIAYRQKGDSVFSRKSYIDGVAYMLMALPENLSSHETSTIRKALPSSMSDKHNANSPRGEIIDPQSTPRGHVILRRCVASLVAALVVFVHLLLTCTTSVFRTATHYEQKHAIVQRIVSRGVVMAAAVGGHGVVLSTKIYGMREGRVGKTMNKIMAWTVENVTYGIQEGLGDGLTLVDKGSKVK